MMKKSKKILYFGLDPSRYETPLEIVHFPLIQTEPLPFEEVKFFFSLPHTHVLFTSRTAVEYFFRYTSARDKTYLCVGEATAKRLIDFGLHAAHVAEEACGEGVMAMLDRLSIDQILYPHSARARPLLPDYLKGRGVPFALYNTFPCVAVLPDLSTFDQLVFTSPSTVTAFATLCPELPSREKCISIGPITQNALNKLFDQAILQSTNHTRGDL